MKKNRMRPIFAILAMAVSGALTFAGGAPAAHANQSTFCIGDATAPATTSPTYMTPGTATTTLTDNTCQDSVVPYDSKSLLVQLTASSTGTTLNFGVEYSQDGIDWYADNTPSLATTSPTYSAQRANSYSWTFASTTPGGGAVPASNNIALKIFNVDVHARYTRVFFSLPPGSTNGAVWARWIGMRQQLAR